MASTDDAEDGPSTAKDETGTPASFPPDDATTPKAPQDVHPALSDEIQSLKAKILELEEAAFSINNASSRGFQPGPGPGPPLNPNLEALLPTTTMPSEEHQRMIDFMYKNRKEWETTTGGKAPQSWTTGVDQMYRRHKIHFTPWNQTENAWATMLKGKLQQDIIYRGPEDRYTRPSPFDPKFQGNPTYLDGDDTTVAYAGRDFDRVIDYGSRRERLRQNFEWELDRLFLEEDIQTQRQRKRKKHKQQAEGAEKKEAEMKGAETTLEPNLGLPELKPLYLDWYAYIKPHLQQDEKDALTYGIVDILLGEPIIVVESQAFHQYFGVSSHKLAAYRKPPGYKLPGRPTPAKGPLPERIRITSIHLCKILSKILEKDMLGLQSETESFVLLRPFKSLIYSRQSLLRWCEELERKFSPTTTWKTESPVDLNASSAFSASSEPSASSASLQGKVSEPDEANVGTQPQDTPTFSEGEQAPQDASDDSKDNERKQGVDSAKRAQTDTDENEEGEDDPNDLTKSLLALKHLRCLLEVMNTDILSRRALLREGKCCTVWFSDLWLLFSPGLEVIAKDGNQAYRVTGTNSGKHGISRYSGPRTWKKEDPFRVTCAHIDFDGKYLGPVCRTLEISKFDGERDITSLAVYPLACHPMKRADFTDSEWEGVRDLPEHDRFRQKLIMRGRKFLEVASVKQMYYTGPTLDALEEVESQVVVDFETAFSVNEAIGEKQDWKPELKSLVGSEDFDSSSEDDGDIGCDSGCCDGQSVVDDIDVDDKQRAKYLEKLLPGSRSVNSQPSIAIIPRAIEDLEAEGGTTLAVSDDELVIMSHRVFGFILRSRKWAQMDLDHLTELYESSPDAGVGTAAGLQRSPGDAQAGTNNNTHDPESAFGRLVLQEGHKDMIISLISQHFRHKESSTNHKGQFDIVKGKGKGLIILLHGAPGVGKTSTAEAVAERFKKTLFQITCGDLGTTASEVERSLETNFALANRWDCILLLDEADVFLAQRNKEDFIRNGLVSVFLRVMEYYSGVLFLTTNRVGDFDEAFSSRIHISLYYPELDAHKTAEIFKINMDMIEDRFILNGRQIDIDKDGIGKFVSQFYDKNPEARWNGRQIRNACQTALALAEHETLERVSRDENRAAGQIVNLRMKHFEKVRDAYLDFANYVKDIYGTGPGMRAKEIQVRATWGSNHNDNRMSDRRRELQRASRPAQSQMGQQPQVPQVHLQQGQPSMLAGGAGIYHPQPQQVQMQVPQYYPYPVAAPAQQMMQQPQGSLGHGAPPPPQNQQAAGQAYQQQQQQQQPPFPNNTQLEYLGNHAGTPQAPAGQGQYSQQPMQQLVPGTSLPPASAGFGPHVPATPMTPGSSFGQQMGSGSA